MPENTNQNPNSPQKGNTSEEIKKDFPEVKKKLGFFDKMKGFKTPEEKEEYNKIYSLYIHKKFQEALTEAKSYIQKNPDSKPIAKLIKKLEREDNKSSKKGENKQNLFTQLFKDKEAKPDESIIDNIVKQKEAKVAEEQEMKKKEAEEKTVLKQDEQEEEIQMYKKKKKSNIFNTLGVLILFIVLGFYAFLYVEVDPQNSVLSLINVENTGSTLETIRTEKEELDKRLGDLKEEIADLEGDVVIAKSSETLGEIVNKRINWSSLLKDIQIVTSKVPRSYLNDISYWNYGGNAQDKLLTIAGEAKNEKVFTLVANLVDTLNEFEHFYNLDYRKYSKSPTEKGSTEYRSSIQLQFNFNTEEELQAESKKK